MVIGVVEVEIRIFSKTDEEENIRELSYRLLGSPAGFRHLIGGVFKPIKYKTNTQIEVATINYGPSDINDTTMMTHLNYEYANPVNRL